MGKEKKVQIKDKIKKMAIKQGMKMVLVAIKHIIISIISALLPYIGTILLAVTLITGFAYILEIFTAEDTSAAVRTAIGTENIADSIEIKSFDGGGYYISMPQDISKRLEKALKKAKVEYADLGIKNTSTIEKFIKAEIVTQYPDLGADLEKDNSSEKLQGAIKIKRATVDKSVGELKESDKKEEMLTYVDKTTFDEYIANNNIEAIKHFTLDESGNLIIASWSYTKKTKTENENIVEENTEYTIKQNSPINYKAQVEKYTMPFEYPLAFLIDGQDVEFAEKLADLALNSEIVITVQDNITTTENIISEKTTVTTEEKNVYSYKKADGSEEYNTETERKKIAEDITTIETKTITESNTPNIEITSVDSWCTKFTKEYSYITSDTGLTSGEPENADPTTVTKFNSIDINGNYINNITDNNGNHMQNTENNTSIEDNEKELEKGDKLQRKENIQYITTAKSTTTSNRVITNKYNSGLSKTEGNEQKFVDAFRSSKQAKGNIMNEPEWLFDILENSDKTANMLDLTKYLLYKATGKDLGVTEFDFSIYEQNSFSGATGGIIGNSVEEKLWFSLRNAGYSEYAVAGVMGNIYAESEFNIALIEYGYNDSTGGIGLCQWTDCPRGSGDGRNTQLKHYAASKGGKWTDENIQIEFLLGELSPGGGADGYATYALLTYNGYSPSDWVNASTPEDAAIAFCWSFERPGIPRMSVRTEAARRYYEEFKGKTISSEFVQYYQGDYADVPYGSSNLANCGCGPTCFAMVATNLTGTSITPKDAVAWCGNAYYVWGAGTSWSYFEAANKHFNLNRNIVNTNSIDTVVEALKNGKMVISSQNQGRFTSSGHFIVLYGIDSNNRITVKDPNKNNAVNKGYNNINFSKEEINEAAASYWIFE